MILTVPSSQDEILELTRAMELSPRNTEVLELYSSQTSRQVMRNEQQPTESRPRLSHTKLNHTTDEQANSLDMANQDSPSRTACTVRRGLTPTRSKREKVAVTVRKIGRRVSEHLEPISPPSMARRDLTRTRSKREKVAVTARRIGSQKKQLFDSPYQSPAAASLPRDLQQIPLTLLELPEALVGPTDAELVPSRLFEFISGPFVGKHCVYSSKQPREGAMESSSDVINVTRSGVHEMVQCKRFELEQIHTPHAIFCSSANIVYECENDCGFQHCDVDLVAAHETKCTRM